MTNISFLIIDTYLTFLKSKPSDLKLAIGRYYEDPISYSRHQLLQEIVKSLTGPYSSRVTKANIVLKFLDRYNVIAPIIEEKEYENNIDLSDEEIAKIISNVRSIYPR